MDELLRAVRPIIRGERGRRLEHDFDRERDFDPNPNPRIPPLPPYVAPQPPVAPVNPVAPARRKRRKMPAKKAKKTYKKRKSSYGDPGLRALTYSLKRQLNNDKRAEALARIERLIGAAGANARANIGIRQRLAEAEGRGSYKFGRRLQRFGEGAFGAKLKSHAMAAIDKGAGMMLGGGMYTGRGSYTDNSLIDTGLGVAEEVPSFSDTGDETGAVVICRKEYVCDIYGPGSPTTPLPFSIQAFSLNPGLEATFPWLSQIAQNYDEYSFIQLMFTFRSTTTDIGSSTNGQCGTVIMATNYNAAAPPFSEKVSMMEYDAAMSCKTTESMRHGVECDPMKLSGAEGKFVRNNPVMSAQDLKTYDHGLFQIAVANSPVEYAGESLGELWVSYKLECRKPKFYASRGLGISQDIYVSGAGTETISFPFGTQVALLSGQQNNIFTRLTVTSGSILLDIPASYAGFLELRLVCEGVTTTGVGMVENLFGNITRVSDMYAGGSAGDAPTYWQGNTAQAIAAGGTMVFVLHVQVQIASNGADNRIVLNWTNLTVAPTQSSLTISEYNSGFSYKAANIGPVGAQSLAPILTNPQGVLVVP